MAIYVNTSRTSKALASRLIGTVREEKGGPEFSEFLSLRNSEVKKSDFRDQMKGKRPVLIVLAGSTRGDIILRRPPIPTRIPDQQQRRRHPQNFSPGGSA